MPPITYNVFILIFTEPDVDGDNSTTGKLGYISTAIGEALCCVDAGDYGFDLHGLLQEFQDDRSLYESLPHQESFRHDTSFDISMENLEESLMDLSLTEDDNCSNVKKILPNMFGIVKYSPPPLLCRHPPPAMGKDDDIQKLREVLNDILIKLGRGTSAHPDRILFGPDNKIGANMLKLLSQETRFEQFLPEFPLLHLRKSKINILFSAYKHAGLVQLLMYMRDDSRQEWSKLITAQHIDEATRCVKRLSQGLHIALLISFIRQLPPSDSSKLIEELSSNRSPETLALHWDAKIQKFSADSSQKNATFALHVEMLKHCDEVMEIDLAERVGGKTGYSLLLAAVKSSLPFLFLNGASSYAPFCTRLLLQHYGAGYFHTAMKHCLYTTPIGNSIMNFSSDTKREIDHKDALKGFRSGTNAVSMVCRMSLVDPFNDISVTPKEPNTSDNLGWILSQNDIRHSVRVAALVLRQNGFNTAKDDTPWNVYQEQPQALPLVILDQLTTDVGWYLLDRFLALEGLCGYSSADIPPIKEVLGPKPLVARAYRSKGVTIRRVSPTLQSATTPISAKDAKERGRQKLLKKEVKQAGHLTSHMNTCQALINPDGSKPKVQKSVGMQKALGSCLTRLSVSHPALQFDASKVVQLGISSVPQAADIEVVTVEFAGVKFRANVTSGRQYLMYVQNGVIKRIMNLMPGARRIILCEEKYSFTPDTLKAATRSQRASNQPSIHHLKPSAAILDDNVYDKDSILSTTQWVKRWSAPMLQPMHNL